MLSINIDHIATIRNARNSFYPSMTRASQLIKLGGGEILTVHLREDRRHIRDSDVLELASCGVLPLNFEIAPTQEMLSIALKIKPKFVCLVPEKRRELTTEGGIDAAKFKKPLTKAVKELSLSGAKVSLFVEPSLNMIEAASECGAHSIELHTGKFALSMSAEELKKLQKAANFAKGLGLGVHAGHGLTFESLAQVAGIKEIDTFHIGHFVITESIFIGLEKATFQMKDIIRINRPKA